MKLLDINHALAHLRNAQQIVLDNADDFTRLELDAFRDGIQRSEIVLNGMRQGGE